MHAERESAGGWANPTSGIVRCSPNGKFARSKSDRYPQSRSGPVSDAGVSKAAPVRSVYPS